MNTDIIIQTWKKKDININMLGGCNLNINIIVYRWFSKVQVVFLYDAKIFNSTSLFSVTLTNFLSITYLFGSCYCNRQKTLCAYF